MTVETIYETPESEINLYIVSQGFTNTCLPEFNNFVSGYLNYMWSKAPYSTMQSKFRVIKVHVPASQEHIPSAYFQFEFLSHQALVGAQYICNPNTTPCSADAYQYLQNECHSDFKARMDNLKTQLPGYNSKSYILAVFNNNYYTGGGGEYCFATTYCNSPLMHRVLLHEFSHTFGLLGDEYNSTVAARDSNCEIILDGNGNQVMIGANEYPLFHDRNVTNKTNLADIPWNYLIPNNTAIPTCNASNSLPNCQSTAVGLFEGATYETTGWFRPKRTCLMRDLNWDSVFCDVCIDLTQERINEHLCTTTNNITENFISRHQYITHWRKASTTLTSDSDIGNNISVNFVSGNSIRLTDGFKAVAGSEFKAYIGDCSIIELNSTYRIANNQTDMVIMKLAAENIKSTPTEDMDEITIYPNPNSDGFLNVMSTKNGNLDIIITDILCKEVLNTKVVNNTVNIADLTSGIYIVKITEEGKTSTKKLIIE